MTDSQTFERLAEKHDQNQRDRFEAVTQWVEYIKETPPEVWGPQQNAVVDGQLESARETGLSADHERRVQGFAVANASDSRPKDVLESVDSPENAESIEEDESETRD